jgi:hypothetical protein
VLKVDRKPAIAVRPLGGLEDSTLWLVSTLVENIGKITSVRALPSGKVYAASQDRHCLWEVSTGIALKAIDIQGPFFIDYTSKEELLILTDTTEVYKFSPNTGTLSQNFMPITYKSPVLFGTISVDRNGTIGPVDESYVIRSHGSGNTDLWQFSANLLTVTYGTKLFPSLGITNSGNTTYVQDAYGHYPWMAEVHEDQGLLLCQGFGDTLPILLCPTASHFAVEDSYDHRLYRHGVDILRTGVTSQTPIGTYPSWTAQISETGWSLYGITADTLAQKSFQDLALWLQQGGIGSYPRPELVGYDLLALMYVIYRNSQRFLVEGRTLITALRYFIGSAPITSTPLELPYDNVIYMKPTKDRITFMNRYERPLVPSPTLTIDLYGRNELAETLHYILTSPYTYTLNFANSNTWSLHCSTSESKYINYSSIVR